jgi:hypothetical protein
MRVWRNGRRAGLRSQFLRSKGSSPFARTKPVVSNLRTAGFFYAYSLLPTPRRHPLLMYPIAALVNLKVNSSYFNMKAGKNMRKSIRSVLLLVILLSICFITISCMGVEKETKQDPADGSSTQSFSYTTEILDQSSTTQDQTTSSETTIKPTTASKPKTTIKPTTTSKSKTTIKPTTPKTTLRESESVLI